MNDMLEPVTSLTVANAPMVHPTTEAVYAENSNAANPQERKPAYNSDLVRARCYIAPTN